jgi:hypothetical protein
MIDGMNEYFERILIIHEQIRGKISVNGKLPDTIRDDI